MIITRDLYLDRLKRKANNELVTRGYEVDVGIVRKESKDNEGKRGLKNLEIGFACNKGNERFYVQSAYSIPTVEKMNQETSSLNSVSASLRLSRCIPPWIVTIASGPPSREDIFPDR